MTRIAMLIVAVVAAVASVGAVFLVYDEYAAPPIVISDPGPGGTIVVEIAGAVETPGTYGVPAGARVVDVVEAAGGTRPDADLGSVNLARRVRDEEQLMIPSQAELAPVSDSGEPESAPERGSNLINVNTATSEELQSLPGIGPALAQRIIDYRTANGPFRAVDQLARVSGISSARVEEMRPLITVGE